MEGLSAESINERAVKIVMEKSLMPTIDQIDSTVCDDATVRFSIEKATNKLELSQRKSLEGIAQRTPKGVEAC